MLRKDMADAKGLQRILGNPGRFAFCLSLRPHWGDGEPEEGLLEAALGERGGGPVDACLVSRRAGDAGIGAAAGLAGRVVDSGGEAVVPLAQAGGGREEILSDVETLRARGVRNLLLVSGDYPAGGGKRKVSFDLDSVQLFMYLREKAGGEAFASRFYAGCVASPFKALEAEQVWQYEKLARKSEAGARFIVSQAGFDLRDYDELVRFCRVRGIDLPVIASVLVADSGLAGRIAAGGIPGVMISSSLRERIAEEEERGEGRKARILRAARMTAALREMGYRGVLIGGRLGGEDLEAIREEAGRLDGGSRECLRESWPGSPRFYYFNRGKEPSLNDDGERALEKRKRPHIMYLLSWAVDYVAFGSYEPMYRLLGRVCRFCEPRPFWKKVLHWVEFLSKAPVYGCRMCGDCTLYACGFLCYEAGCPKRNLNGPCGGSVDGFCEVHPGRELCFWVRVYDCLKWKSARPTFTAPAIPPKDRGLDGTCSWINFCLGRDHRHIKAP